MVFWFVSRTHRSQMLGVAGMPARRRRTRPPQTTPGGTGAHRMELRGNSHLEGWEIATRKSTLNKETRYMEPTLTIDNVGLAMGFLEQPRDWLVYLRKTCVFDASRLLAVKLHKTNQPHGIGSLRSKSTHVRGPKYNRRLPNTAMVRLERWAYLKHPALVNQNMFPRSVVF